MNKLRFFIEKAAPKVLCLGAHADDIEIGCGGTILKLIEDLPKIQICWIIFSGDSNRVNEAQQSANHLLKSVESKQIDIQNFRESYFPFVGAQIKDYFERLKLFSPDIIFTHYSNDAHQDHKLISNLTWNAFRDHFILEYEIPKYDGDITTPNLYVQLDEAIVERKISCLCNFFRTQAQKQWFSAETFQSIMRLRGIECNSPSKYAEAFHCRKIVF